PTQHYPMPCCTPAYDSSCYPSYDNSSKRSCRRSPTDLAGFRRQQHLMHLQAQFSLYVRRQETFWT
ncbi:Centrosomal and chromosomal factorlike, partial [Caligus rogercresseyi]